MNIVTSIQLWITRIDISTIVTIEFLISKISRFYKQGLY